MSREKRKRSAEDSGERSLKKNSQGGPAQTVKVSISSNFDEWSPIFASTPGLSLPTKTTFKPYKKPRSNTSGGAGHSSSSTSEVLLHSSTHPKLDYTAREEETEGAGSLVKHYVGVYDPESGELQLVQARRVVVRGTLQSARVNQAHTEQESGAPNILSARSALGLTFGTKKSQKAIRSLTENTIQASPVKPSAASSPDKPALDDVAAAIVESMAISTGSMPSREEMQNAVDEGKPRPKPHLDAETAADVYPVDELVGTGVLRLLQVKEWQEKVESGEDIRTKSRFVCGRVRNVVQSGNVKNLKALKYVLLLVEWLRCLKSGSKGGKKVPKDEELKAAIAGVDSQLLAAVGKRFSEGNELNKWHIDNLITHICALALTIDNYTTDIKDIQEDLRLENREITRYFLEIGCKVTNPSETERSKMKITKAEAAAHKLAKLKLPLEFPKNRVEVQKKRR